MADETKNRETAEGLRSKANDSGLRSRDTWSSGRFITNGKMSGQVGGHI